MDRKTARARLEEALSSSDLCSEDSVRTLVNKAFLRYADGKEATIDAQTLNSRFEEVWTFLSELRGVGSELAKDSKVVDDIEGRGWKVKEDTGTMRVLYRKGPEGTPLHTLCLEGMIHGPLATALCVAWEAPYFKDWWPQFTVPTFKISESKWLEQPKPGQVIASVRFKVPWPFTAREIVLEAYAVDYLIKDVLLVLMKTLPPGPSPLSKNGPPIPPEDKGVTRMEVVGGYIFQQIAPSQCYFRTIADIDLKLALVPAWVINFISRQLAGLGLKLFEKVVQDVTSAKDTKFVKVFQRLLESDAFLQEVKTGLAAPKADVRNGTASEVVRNRGQHPSKTEASRLVVEPHQRNASGGRSEPAEAGLPVQEQWEQETAASVGMRSAGGGVGGGVEERPRLRGFEAGTAQESGRNLLETILGRTEELGAPPGRNGFVEVNRNMEEGDLALLRDEARRDTFSQASSSRGGEDQGPSGLRVSQREGAAATDEIQHCFQVIERAMNAVRAREVSTAYNSAQGRKGRDQEEERTNSRGGRIGMNREADDQIDPQGGRGGKSLETDEVKTAVIVLDKATQLMRTLAK